MLYVPKPSNKPTIDLLCSVVGDTRRAENWSTRELTARCVDTQLDPHTTVTVSFYFLLATPPVIVDMEPAPAVSKFWCDVKRTWAHEQGIVYVPIFLRDKLTRTQFEERLKEEKRALAEALKAAGERRALRAGRKKSARAAGTGYTISMPEVQALIDEETMIRIGIEEKAGLKLRGSARQRRITKVREDVEREYLSRVRDGSVGHQLRRQQSALAVGG